MSKHKVLVIIVTYNGMKWLDKCLNSVKESTVVADLFIVDNGSTDGSIEYIKENYPDAIFVESKENLGFGKANNIGISYALRNNYDYVYLLNQDAWIEPDTLSKVINISLNHPDFGILSPLQLNKEKTRLDENFSHCVPKSLLSDLLCHTSLRGVYGCEFVMAAHWLISKECIISVGGFSPAFPHYGEDNNYIQRAQYKGYEIGIVPEATGIHDREFRTTSVEKKRYINYISSIIIFNNPIYSYRVLRVIKLYLKILLSNRREFPFKYLIRTLKAWKKSKQYRKIAEENLAFLIV